METPAANSGWKNLLAVLALVALAWGAFGGALRCGFVYFDDDQYVFENPPIARGLTAEGVRWAFTTGHAANWQIGRASCRERV